MTDLGSILVNGIDPDAEQIPEEWFWGGPKTGCELTKQHDGNWLLEVREQGNIVRSASFDRDQTAIAQFCAACVERKETVVA